MRLGIGLLTIATLACPACMDSAAARRAAEWGCGPVGGLDAISGEQMPDWLIVGELTETREAPAAFADIACNLATDEHLLFVGVAEYWGGATDAEKLMLEQLEAMIAKGVPLIVERIGEEEHPYTIRNKSKAEQAWAEALMARVSATGAEHALLLLPHASAMAQPVARIGDRFAGFSPMPVFLDGSVISLEVSGPPSPELSGPAIRFHPEKQGGFHGELALAHMTRPLVELVLPAGQTIAEATIEDQERETQRIANVLRDAQIQARQLLAGDADAEARAPDSPLEPELDLPEFKAE